MSAKEPIVIRGMVDGRVVYERVVPAFSEEFDRSLIEGDRRELIRKLRLIDRPELAKRLREGGPLLKYERDFLADLVEGKKPPRHRPPSVDTALRNDIMAEWYLHMVAQHPDMQKRRIVRSIATMFGKSPDYVRRAVRSLTPRRRKDIERLIAKLLADREEAEEMQKEAKKKWDREMREM